MFKAQGWCRIIEEIDLDVTGEKGPTLWSVWLTRSCPGGVFYFELAGVIVQSSMKINKNFV